jgi:hypothetical protein
MRLTSVTLCLSVLCFGAWGTTALSQERPAPSIGCTSSIGLMIVGPGGRLSPVPAAVANAASSSARAANDKGNSVGPFEIASKDSTTWLRFQFAGQLRMDFERLDQGKGKDASNSLTTYARRLRPIFSVNLPEQHLLFRLHLSTAPKSLELMDLYSEYQARPNLRVRFGQYKVPFTRYRMQSFQRLTFVDWAIVTKAFGAERQMGVALHNGYEKPAKYGYAFGVFSGANARASHAVLLPEIYKESKPNPSDLAHASAAPKFHPELFLHLSYRAAGLDVQSDTDESRGDLRCGAMFSAAWDLDPTPHQDFRLRLAPEFLAKCRGMSFSTVGYAGFAKVGDPSDTELAMVGGVVQGAYRINNRYELSARYAIVDLQDALLNDVAASLGISPTVSGRSDEGRAETSYSGESPSAAASQAGAVQLMREQEVRIGVNTYILGHTLKWQNDAGWLMHDRSDGDLTDFVVRSQFQVTF